MTFFYNKFDAQLVIYLTANSSRLIGFQSEFTSTPFPATGKTIQGFKFDHTRWKSSVEENDSATVPSFWDPSDANVETNFQVGIGDNDDLIVEDITIQQVGDGAPSNETWSPQINHGYYYSGDDEFYLYSDDGLTVYPIRDRYWISELDTTISGGNYIDLEFIPKTGIPISAKSFSWNDPEGVYEVDDLARHVIEFTSEIVDGETQITRVGDEILWDKMSLGYKEFILDNSSSGVMRVIFNQQVVQPVGRRLTTVTGYYIEELEAMESVGEILEQDFQQHHLHFAPVDRTVPLQIILENEVEVQELTVVSGFTVSGYNEIQIDYDLGLLKFGSEALGGLPASGYNIKAHYYKTLAVEYEPKDSRDYALETSANINPVRRFSSDGFVCIREKTEDPASLVLEADLPLISANYFGPLYIGNSFAKIIATVTTSTDEPVEGQEIFFEIVSGSSNIAFGRETLVSAISNAVGVATTFLNPPRVIDDLGGATNQVETTPSGSQLFIADYVPPGDSESLYLFQVHASDDILGIPKTDLLSFYEDFIQEQDTVSGQTTGPLVDVDLGSSYDWISGAFEDFIKWEILHRAYHNFSTPIAYEVTDSLRIGKKTVIAVLDSEAINPHTGTTPAFVPLQPVEYTISASGTYIDFDQTLPAIGVLYKAYLVAGPTKTTIRAYTTNQRTGQFIYSNNVDILVDIPEGNKGLISVDTINSVPSGLLGNALYYDQEDIELESVNITTSGLLPLGWRIRSSGITIASALDSITFLDINPLTLSSDGVIGHTFEVII